MTPLTTRTPITAEAIASIAQRISVSLPTEFLNFYVMHNGGRFEERIFEHMDDEFRIQEFLSFGNGADSIEETYKDVFMENKLTPNDILPFAADSSGDYFCISVDPATFGEVIFFDSENYDIPERCTIKLSPSFGDFIKNLKRD